MVCQSASNGFVGMAKNRGDSEFGLRQNDYGFGSFSGVLPAGALTVVVDTRPGPSGSTVTFIDMNGNTVGTAIPISWTEPWVPVLAFARESVVEPVLDFSVRWDGFGDPLSLWVAQNEYAFSLDFLGFRQP
jgi:hypothetical protein